MYFDFHIRKILFHVLIFYILLDNRSIDNFSLTNKMRNTPISHCQLNIIYTCTASVPKTPTIYCPTLKYQTAVPIGARFFLLTVTIVKLC